MPTFDEALEKTDRLCIDLELFEQVEDNKLKKELERLEEKRERLLNIRNESLDRVILKIYNIKNYLENKNI
jgi:hypothetical protein